MVSIPWPLSSAPGRRSQESSGRLINCFAEPLGKVVQGTRGLQPPQVVWRGVPGLSLFGASTHTVARGHVLVGSTLYAGWSATASRYDSTGAETSLTGTLNGTDGLFWARNNKTPTPDLVAVSPANGAFSVSSSTIINFADPNIGSPNCVCFMDGFFIFSYGDGTLQASGLNAVTIATTDKTKAQSKTGGLTRVAPFNGQLIALGPNFGEVYSDTANPTGFPFSRSYVLQRGLLGPYALAGHEDGFASALIWVADDASVVRHNGTPNPQKISPPELDRLIAGVSDTTTLEASVYISDDHAKWVISCPTFTWEFDLATEKWNERYSYQNGRWRAKWGCKAFGKWIVGDTNGGRLLYVDNSNFTEFGDPLQFVMESGPVGDFPNRTKVHRADFDFVLGVGDATGPDPTGTQPQVGIQWSNNGGITWSNEYLRDLGTQATSNPRVTMLRTGMTETDGRRWRLNITDPVYRGFLGATQDMQNVNH